MKTVCFFTGTRAEYGLLRPLMHLVDAAEDLQLRLIVSGSHLHEAYGRTIQTILDDGFTPDAEVPILSDGDDASAMCRAVGAGIKGYGDALHRLRPDLLVVLGDRYEGLAVAQAAAFHHVPVAHLHGGERSEGVLDELFRHAMTKLSHLHFTSTGEYRRRVIQLGEQPDRVFNVGAIGLDNIRRLDPMSESEMAERIGFSVNGRTLLVTLHPETSDPTPAKEQATRLLDGLERIPDTTIVLTMANADQGGRAINQVLEEYAKQADPTRVKLFDNMGQRLYLSAMARCGAVVGNSSSGIIEAPAMGVPTVNVGDRQRGRMRAESILDCKAETEATATAVARALTPTFRDMARTASNPYGNGRTADTILHIIRKTDMTEILDKTFHDLSKEACGQS